VRAADPSRPRGPVDWDVAARLGARVVPRGPRASRDEIAELVAGLRSAAGEAGEHAARITGLALPEGVPGPRVHVVDRPGWVRANTRLMAAMTAPLTLPTEPSAAVRLAGATQVGAVLGLLSGKVLGQLDPFTADAAAPGGRLLLVAPNVLSSERTMRLDPDDFRLWVCLHEQTHALQFGAAPWLAPHLRERTGALLTSLSSTAARVRDPGSAGAPGARSAAGGPAGERTLADVVRAVTGIVTGPDDGRAGRDAHSVLDLLDAQQRTLVDEVGAIMALLEGHADVAMDAVGRGVVPSVRRIRARFEARRDAGARAGGTQRVLRRLLGLDAKLAQYRDGAAFVRAVRRAVGTDGLNVVWTGPELLPTAAEIAEPGAWLRRVHG
jgi:coenzyme F420 biosynthesis associated uncharacterized protein